MEREGRSKRRTQTDFLARRRQSGKAMQRENPSQSLIRKGEEEEEEIVKGDDRNDGNDEVDEEMEEAEEDEESCATPRCVPRRPRRTSQGATRRVQRVVKLVGPGRSHVKHTSSASSQRSEAFMTHLPDSPPRGRSSIFQFAETRLKTPLKATVAASHIVNEQKGEDVSIETEKFEEQEDDTLEETEENPEVDESQEDTTKGVEDDEETNELSCGGPHAIDLSPPPLGLEEDDTSEDEEETEEETEEKEEEYRHLQEAHARFEAEQTEHDALRQELEAYVASLPTRCDTEGDKLVEFPRNFQQIVSLMTAQDIVSDEISTTPKAGNDHKSWSQVLIQNSLAKQQAFGTLDESEDSTDGEGSLTAKIALKIARIRQLDAVLEEKLGKNLYAAPTITLKKGKHVNPQEPEVILGIAGSAVRRSPLARDAGPTSRSSSSLLMGSTPSGLKAMNHVERNRKIVENGGKANLTRDEEYRVKRLLRESKQKEVTAEDTSDVPTVTEFRLEQQQQDEIEKLIAEKRGLYPSAIIMALNDVTEEEEVVDDPVRNKKDQRKANVVQETKRERLRQQRLQRIEEELKFLHDNENVPILPDDDDDPSDGCSSERSFMTTTSMLSTTSTRSGVTRRQLDQFVASEVTKADHTKASREEIQQLLRSLAHLPLPTSRPVTTATV